MSQSHCDGSTSIARSSATIPTLYTSLDCRGQRITQDIELSNSEKIENLPELLIIAMRSGDAQAAAGAASLVACRWTLRRAGRRRLEQGQLRYQADEAARLERIRKLCGE